MNEPKIAVVFDLTPSQIAASHPATLGKKIKEQYDAQKRKATYIRWEVKVAE